MAFNKSNCCILIVLISMLYSLTVVSANLNTETQNCLNFLHGENGFCGVENATPLQCVQNAFRHFTLAKPIPTDFVKQYYVLLFELLDHESILLPSDFCNKVAQNREEESGSSSSYTQPPIDLQYCMNYLQPFWSDETDTNLISKGRYAAIVAYYFAERGDYGGLLNQYLDDMIVNVRFQDHEITGQKKLIASSSFLENTDNYGPLAYCSHLFQPDFESTELISLLSYVSRKINDGTYN